MDAARDATAARRREIAGLIDLIDLIDLVAPGLPVPRVGFPPP